jgi:anti-sigma regulatory factor (Ser/Thr protein kinase)
VIAGLAVRETAMLAGRAERARVARAFVAAVLGPGHPSTDVAVLLVSEIFGNSVRHSRSGDPGEMITVAVKVTGSAVRVEVIDLRGPGVPELFPAGGMRKVAAGSSLLPASRRGGGGVGAADGRLHGSSCRTVDRARCLLRPS